MLIRLQLVAIALIVACVARPLFAEDTNFGLRDPAAGTVKEFVFGEPPACGGDHDVVVQFHTFTFGPKAIPAPWLIASPTGNFDQSSGGGVDVQIPLDKLAPGNYSGVIITTCTSCTKGACKGQQTADVVQLSVAAPATFGASGADKNFGGLVDGKPVSVHDLVHNIVDELKDSTFYRLTGAKEVIEHLESHYIDRALTSQDLSDVTFVKTESQTSNKGRLGSKVTPIEDEDPGPGEGSYASWGFLGAEEEIFVGVDTSLMGLSEARKNPKDYYIFTIDGELGVVNKADFVHTIIHEGFHAYQNGTYNTDKPDGSGRAACLEEEQEGFRVGNAAARALGLAEDTTTVGASYGGCSNPNYNTLFPELVAGQEAKDPTKNPQATTGIRRPGPTPQPAPAPTPTPTPSSSAPAPKPTPKPSPGPRPSPAPTPLGVLLPDGVEPERNFCQNTGFGMGCEGIPNYALACDIDQLNGNGCTLAGTGLPIQCDMNAEGWQCSAMPPAVMNCDANSCVPVPAVEACDSDGALTQCASLPTFGLACTEPTICEFVDPLTGWNEPESFTTTEPAIGVATQVGTCANAGASEFIEPVKIDWLMPQSGNDLVTAVSRAFAAEATAFAGLPSERLAYAFTAPDITALTRRWPWDGSNSDAGASDLPSRGVVDVSSASTGMFGYGGHTYQLNASQFDSATVAGDLDEAFQGSGRLDVRSTNIGGQSYTSALYPDYQTDFVVSQFERAGYPRLQPNPCRGVLVPVDPNYTRTGRSGGNSWGAKLDDQWAIKRIGYTDDVTSAWQHVDDNAEPVVVAIIDTGLDWHHADIAASSIWRNTDEVPGNGVDDDNNGYVDDVIGWDFVSQHNRPWDYDGHGTAVTGVIAASHNNQGIAGVNPAAKIMVLKGINNFGTTRAAWLAEAIVYAVDNGARVINLSVGGGDHNEMERAALQYATDNGVLLIAAAGNEGVEINNFSPADFDGVLTVGATDIDNAVADFSNLGRAVDIVAPGVDVLSLRARATDANYRPLLSDEYTLGEFIVGADKRYVRVSGTSFSAPMVTATAAYVWAQNPELSAQQVRSILTATATDIEAPGRDSKSGYGMIDPRAALQVTAGFSVTAEVSRVALTPADSPSRVTVTGTADAQGFKRAWVQIGPGEEPTAWRFVGQKRKLPIRDGTLAKIPLSQFTERGLWTIVVNVEDRYGVVRRASATINIP